MQATHRDRKKAPSAPFLLRCGALLIDYTILSGTLAVITVVARMMGGGARVVGETVETFGYVLVLAAAIVNLFVLPSWTGRTIGKWATGLRIESSDGTSIGFARTMVRHTAGFLLTIVTLGLGYVIALFTPQGRALHDFIAGTRVVRHERRRLQRRS